MSPLQSTVFLTLPHDGVNAPTYKVFALDTTANWLPWQTGYHGKLVTMVDEARKHK